MTISTQLAITYAEPSAEKTPTDLLVVEQEAWAPYTGVVTKAEMVRYLASMLYGDEYQSSIDCGITFIDGIPVLVCLIYVYPRVADLVYQFFTSYGTLSGRSVEMLTVEEQIDFNLTTEGSPSHPPREIKSAEWRAECYNSEGAVIDPPALSIDSESITTPIKVVGSSMVTYVTERHSYILSVPRREEAIDDNFSAAVYGVYDGGINWREIEMPPGIEKFELDAEAKCGWGSSGTVTAGDDEDYPVTDGVHTRTTDVDYCSGIITQEEIT